MNLYVCRFSSGHIKVGRSSNPACRIAQHVDRVSCVGITLTNHFILSCPSAVFAETRLIRRCTEQAANRLSSEWFDGLDYDEVCGWAIEYAPISEPTWPMGPDAELLIALGGPHKVVKLLGMPLVAANVQRVKNWKFRGIPAQQKVNRPDLFMPLLRPVVGERVHQASVIAERVGSLGIYGKASGKAGSGRE